MRWLTIHLATQIIRNVAGTLEVKSEKMKTHDGKCHCGAVSFSFKHQPIVAGLRCNCSICSRKGIVMSTEYIPADHFKTLDGLNNLTLYRFGDEDVNHWFCNCCGIYTFHDLARNPGAYRVNLGCIEGLDPLSVEIRLIDGKSF